MCHGSAYEIAFGSAKRIVTGSAKRIAAGSAKRIADYWTDVWVAADAAAMTAKRTDMHRLQELVRLHCVFRRIRSAVPEASDHSFRRIRSESEQGDEWGWGIRPRVGDQVGV